MEVLDYRRGQQITFLIIALPERRDRQLSQPLAVYPPDLAQMLALLPSELYLIGVWAHHLHSESPKILNLKYYGF